MSEDNGQEQGMCEEPEVGIGALGYASLRDFGKLGGEFCKAFLAPPGLDNSSQPVGGDALAPDACPDEPAHNRRHGVCISAPCDGFDHGSSQVIRTVCHDGERGVHGVHDIARDGADGKLPSCGERHSSLCHSQRPFLGLRVGVGDSRGDADKFAEPGIVGVSSAVALPIPGGSPENCFYPYHTNEQEESPVTRWHGDCSEVDPIWSRLS